MKTQIIQTYKPRDGYFFDKILNLDKETTIVFRSKYNAPSYFDVLNNGILVNSFDFSKIGGFDTSTYQKGYFKTKNGFGIINLTEDLLIWETNDLDNPKIIKVSNPFPPDEHLRKLYVIKTSFDEHTNELICGMSDYFYYNYPPRYISNLIIEKTFAGAKWTDLFELPKQNFPPTASIQSNDNMDWLNIREIFVKNADIFVHTTGGLSTRLKSGNMFEFSIVAKFDKNKEWVKNFIIEEGVGNINSTNDLFIIQAKSKKSKLYVYNTNDFNMDFEIALTSKQNLGEEKSNDISADIIGDRFYIFNQRFLNICRIINK
jgi:hypothetical protein